MSFWPHAHFEAALARGGAPLPWDCVLSDDRDRITIIDFDGNDVAFILLGVDRERGFDRESALRLARNVVTAANMAGGYLATP